jgi:hypothetical protein
VALAVNLLLPVERQMILILADDHLGEQPRAGQTLLDQARGQRRDDDAFGVGILGPNVEALDELRRFPVQFLGDFLAQPAPAFRLLLHFRWFEHHPLGFQMRGQGLARGTPRGGRPRRCGLFRHRSRRAQGFEAGQQEFELFGIEALVLRAAEVTLEEEGELLPEQFVFDLHGLQRALQGGHPLAQRAEFVGERSVHRELQRQTRGP